MRWLWMILVVSSLASAAVLEVPQQYGTIQMALDSLLAGDTVLVNSGVYGEALVAPCVAFTLLGNVPGDTVPTGRPVIDATLSGQPLSPGLTLCGPNLTVIRSVVFHNRMTAWGYGGIRALGSGGLEISNCKFDSTGVGIALHDTLTPAAISHTVFEDCYGRCIGVVDGQGGSLSAGRLQASHCRFSGSGASEGLVNLSDSCVLDFCTFKDVQGLAMLHVKGRGVIVRGCVFGPNAAVVSNVLEVNYGGIWPTSVRIEGNTFGGLHGVIGSVIFVQGDCYRDTVAMILGNHFYDNWRNSQCIHDLIVVQPGVGECNDSAYTVLIENNVIEACSSGFSGRAILDLAGVKQIHGNTFRGFLDGSGAVYVENEVFMPQTMQWNRFEGTAMGVIHNSTTAPMDARFNWWGDSTGPWANDNPDGQGAGIWGPGTVEYVPWLTDTMQQEMVVMPKQAVVESPLLLEVYPNPFNAQARIRLTVRTAGVYRVELYNLLGQKVAMVFEGAVIRELELPLDGEALASGIYWLRAENRLTKAVGMGKVLVLK